MHNKEIFDFISDIMRLFSGYLNKRKKIKNYLEENRHKYEKLYWEAYTDAGVENKLNFIARVEMFISLVAIMKSKLALICPVEARAIYAYILGYLTSETIANEDLPETQTPTRNNEYPPEKQMPEKIIESYECDYSKINANGLVAEVKALDMRWRR